MKTSEPLVSSTLCAEQLILPDIADRAGEHRDRSGNCFSVAGIVDALGRAVDVLKLRELIRSPRLRSVKIIDRGLRVDRKGQDDLLFRRRIRQRQRHFDISPIRSARRGRSRRFMTQVRVPTASQQEQGQDDHAFAFSISQRCSHSCAFHHLYPHYALAFSFYTRRQS